MSSSRMAFKPFMSLTWLLWTTTILSTTATAQQQQQSSRIPSEITDFVPSCARDCFRSFIVANFGSSGCGSSPSLQCLCTKTGASGYTLGEGAFSCSVAETDRGNCKGADAGSGVPLGAYNMCSRVPNAARPTHDTIVATLIIPSGTGGLVVPTAVPTSSRSSSSSTSTSTSPSSSPSTFTSTPSSTFVTSTSSTPTLTPTSTPAEESQTPAAVANNSPPRLSAPQIAGISLGVIAGVVAFGVLLIFLARCVRKRRFGDQDLEGGFAKMRDSLSYGPGSNQGTPPALHGGLQISNPIRKPTVEMDFQRPVDPYRPYYGAAQATPTEWQQQTPPEPVHPGMIGIAISPHKPVAVRGSSNTVNTPPPTLSPGPKAAPPVMMFTPPSRNNTMDQSRSSPPKPTLTLAIPKGPRPIAGGGNGAGAGAGAAGARDSIVTEFAEDGEGESNPNTSSIWRPPPSDPQSASTYYFADKGGNWILRRTSTTNKRKPNPAAASRTPISPQIEELPSPDDRTRAERAAQDFPMVAPLRLSRNLQQQPQLGSPIAFKDQSRFNNNRSSSIYASNNPSRSGASPVAAAPLPPSNTYYSMMREGRDLTGAGNGKPKQQQQRGIPAKNPNRRVSYQSSTSIESGAAGGPFEDYDDDDIIIENEPQVSLSPVAQSPNTPLEGRSPVSYPKIPKNNGSLFPPTPSATNTSRDTSRSPSGQASPTLGASAPAPASVNKNKRLLYPGGLGLPANPNPNRNPGQVRTGSPETRLGVFPTAVSVPAPVPTPPVAELPAAPQRRPSPRVQPQQQQQQQQQGLGISASSEQRQQYQYQAYNPSQQQRYQAPSPQPAQHQQQQQQRPRAPPQPHPQMQPQQRYPSPPQQQNQKQQTAAPAPGVGQSSLLAKRLGAEKAAALSLGGPGESNSRPRREKWTRESFAPEGGSRTQQQQAVQKKPTNNNNNGNGNGNVNGYDDNDFPYPIPVTPGWIPQLTPTKRGDDLFLSVQ